MSDDKCRTCIDREIVEGWARISTAYVPRELTLHEKAQFIRAEAHEKADQLTPFVLGEPIR